MPEQTPSPLPRRIRLGPSVQEVLAAVEKSQKPKLLDMNKGAPAYTGLSRTRLYQEIKSGRLDAVKVGGRRYATREALDQLIERIVNEQIR